MAIVRILPNGDTETQDDLVQPAGSISIDSVRNEIRIHDGVTPGGHRVPNLDAMKNVFLVRDEGLGEDAGFPESGVGFLVRNTDSDPATFVVRSLAGGTGISVTNGDGVSGNAELAVNSAWLDVQLNNLFASTSEIRTGAADKLIPPAVAFNAAAYVTVAYAGTIALDFDTGFNFEVTATGNLALDTPTNIKRQTGIIEVIASGTDCDVSLSGLWADLSGSFPVTVPDSERLYIAYFINAAGNPAVSGILGV